MRVDHRCCNILVSKQGLNGANVRAPLEQVGGETVTARIATLLIRRQ